MYNSPDNVYSDDLTTPKRTKMTCSLGNMRGYFVLFFLFLVQYYFFHHIFIIFSHFFVYFIQKIVF